MTSDDTIRRLRNRLDAIQRDLRQAIDALDDPQGKALLEVSAEVVGGLSKAFADYHARSEPAWLQVAKRLFP